MSDDSSNGSLWLLAGIGLAGVALGALAGVGLGALAGLMFAPRSGRETRKILRSKAEESRGRVRHHANRLREQAASWAEHGLNLFNKSKDTTPMDLSQNGMDAAKEIPGRTSKGTSGTISQMEGAARKAI
jgi:gas vesicle protein